MLQAADADVLVLASFDYDLKGMALEQFAERIGGYPHRLALRPNRGVPVDWDVDGNGRIERPVDAQGYGEFQGQGGLAILSRLPIDEAGVRDLSAFRWTDLPGHVAPAGTHPDQRLSTTAHWDIPVETATGSLHLLVWHATPPVFDGPEDRNGRRNHDEAALWAAYLSGELGYDPPRNFVLAGVANLDPVDGDGRPDALKRLIALASDPKPRSQGAELKSVADAGANLRHRGDPALDTADWQDEGRGPGNLRVDYVLPARHLNVVDTGVLWPLPESSLGRDVERASRHRLVWLDIRLPERRADSRERIGRAETRQQTVQP